MSTSSIHLLTAAEHRRALVIRMARVGLPDCHIAFKLGLDLADLLSEFTVIMKHAQIDAQMEILETLFERAKSGQSITATIYWLNHYAAGEKKQSAKPPKKERETYGNGILPTLKVRGPDGRLYD